MFKGFLERELIKDNISVDDNGDNPLAPLPKEMNDLEVQINFFQVVVTQTIPYLLNCKLPVIVLKI